MVTTKKTNFISEKLRPFEEKHPKEKKLVPKDIMKKETIEEGINGESYINIAFSKDKRFESMITLIMLSLNI